MVTALGGFEQRWDTNQMLRSNGLSGHSLNTVHCLCYLYIEGSKYGSLILALRPFGVILGALQGTYRALIKMYPEKPTRGYHQSLLCMKPGNRNEEV